MSQEPAKEEFYGVVVPVRDLPGMRAFYRDVVQLGDPKIDSNFWVEFKLPGGGILVLEHRESAEAPKPGQGIAWLLGVRRLDEMVKHLAERDVKPLRPEQEIPGSTCCSFQDPEGNPFTLYALK